jgi:Golgi phosphoprotein 3 (GPP34)
MDGPTTLHGQLYLLAYDCARQRFSGKNSLFEFGLRAAMFTDLYLTGHLEDRADRPRPTACPPPEDPVLRWAFDQAGSGRSWAALIARNNRADRIVRDQLRAEGSLCAHRHRLLGCIPTDRDAPRDDGVVEALTYQVRDALHRALLDLPAEPRPLALGLLAVQAQMDTVLTRDESSRHRAALRELTAAAIEPIMALPGVIARHHDDVRAAL